MNRIRFKGAIYVEAREGISQVTTMKELLLGIDQIKTDATSINLILDAVRKYSLNASERAKSPMLATILSEISKQAKIGTDRTSSFESFLSGLGHMSDQLKGFIKHISTK